MTDEYILKFIYDASGNVLGFEYITADTTDTDVTYYYEKNIFGDVVAIYDEYGTKVGEYGFNSYGQNHVVTNLTDDNIASLNPIRYRSYYYDTDIYLYYLQSRYYDPVTCRFINADGVIAGVGGDLRGYNLFAYCFNNPVSMTDPNGDWPSWANKLVAAVAVVAVVAAVAAISVATAGVGTTIIAAGGGAAVGITGKYVEDVTYNIASGKQGFDILSPSSTWQDYLSSGLTGSITGMIDVVAPGTGKSVKNLFDAFLKPTLKQSLDIASGQTDRIDYKNLAFDIGIRLTTSSLLKTPYNLNNNTVLNKFIGGIPCSMGRGVIKSVREKSEKLLPIFN